MSAGGNQPKPQERNVTKKPVCSFCDKPFSLAKANREHPEFDAPDLCSECRAETGAVLDEMDRDYARAVPEGK